MQRFAYQASVEEFLMTSYSQILGELSKNHRFRHLEQQQINAWKDEVDILNSALNNFLNAHLFLEFEIPRIGKRADAVVIIGNVIVVLEFKIGSKVYDSDSLDQAHDYALDMKNFHKASHSLRIIPILVATRANAQPISIDIAPDGVAQPIKTNSDSLPEVLKKIQDSFPSQSINALDWANSDYHPTPTIIEAAKRLYSEHNVDEISRSDAGAINLSRTSERIFAIIDDAKENLKKVICLITGVPGAGKTLAGLNIATKRMQYLENEHAVFLSGNGPLVDVLRAALVKDKQESEKDLPKEHRTRAKKIHRDVEAFIQNIHHFRDEYLPDPNLSSQKIPVDKVVIFDESQRAWNREKTSSFMRKKRQQSNFDMSEPNFLLSVMNRHHDWCVVICLIGSGQEIYEGEAGISEWVMALKENYRDWEVYYSEQLLTTDYSITNEAKIALARLNLHSEPALHLAVSIRSFRAENLSSFIGEVISGNFVEARQLKEQLTGYPIYVSRSLEATKDKLKKLARGSERIGLVASSNAIRLKADGIFVKGRMDPTNWFLKGKNDIRSSYFLEDVATEFVVQGLELDWVGVCWDANFRFANGKWRGYNFSGSKWQEVHQQEMQIYIANSYRVLLTRGRQGLVIYVPQGDPEDNTRQNSFYDPTFQFLLDCGIESI